MYIIRFHISSLRCCKLYWIMILCCYLREINKLPAQLLHSAKLLLTVEWIPIPQITKWEKNVLLRIDKIHFFCHNTSSGLLNKHFAFIKLIWKNTYLEWIKDVTGLERSMEFSDTEMYRWVLPRELAQNSFLCLFHMVRVIMASYYHLCLQKILASLISSVFQLKIFVPLYFHFPSFWPFSLLRSLLLLVF